MNANLARSRSKSQKTAWNGRFRTCACCAPTADTPSPGRRNFLAGGIAALSLSATASTFAAAQTAPAKTRIDVHHHYLPPMQAEAMAANRVGGVPKWTPQLSLDDMEKAGVATAVLSLVQPGVWFGDAEEARKLARQCNDYGAQLRRDYPG